MSNFRLFATAVGASTFFNLFLPVVIRNQNYALLLILRILQGLAEGMLYPTCHGIWSKWAPPLERSRLEVSLFLIYNLNRLATISFCGSYAGPVLGYALGGFLVEKYGAYSILSPFYVSCTLNFIWLGVFVLSAHDTPASHPTILQEERDYIERTIGDKVSYLLHDQY